MVTWLKTAAAGSWQTTAIGILGALYVTLQPILAQNRMPTKSELILAVISVLGGLAAKDHNVTGTGSASEPIRGPASPPAADDPNRLFR